MSLWIGCVGCARRWCICGILSRCRRGRGGCRGGFVSAGWGRERWRRVLEGGGLQSVFWARHVCGQGPGGERFGTFSVVVFKDDARFCYLMFSPGIDCRVVLHSAHVGQG